MDTVLFVRAFSAFFAIMNPFVALPIFLSLTEGYDPSMRRSAGLRVAGYSAALCAVIAVSGTMILRFFGIDVDHFRIAGGIVLVTIALGMLSGEGSTAHKGTPAERQIQLERDEVAFYPMAFPMIVGPGTITTIVVLTSNVTQLSGYVAIIVALALDLLALTVVLMLASRIGRHMSSTLRTVMTRIMGMILMATAVQMSVEGLKTTLPGLAG